MTIKLKTITVMGGETDVLFQYDDEKGLQTTTILKSDLDRDLEDVKDLLGREITTEDFNDVVKKRIDAQRKGQKTPSYTLDLTKLIDVEIET